MTKELLTLAALREFQRIAVEETRLGIPFLFVEEAPHGLMALAAGDVRRLRDVRIGFPVRDGEGLFRPPARRRGEEVNLSSKCNKRRILWRGGTGCEAAYPRLPLALQMSFRYGIIRAWTA